MRTSELRHVSTQPHLSHRCPAHDHCINKRGQIMPDVQVLHNDSNCKCTIDSQVSSWRLHPHTLQGQQTRQGTVSRCLFAPLGSLFDFIIVRTHLHPSRSDFDSTGRCSSVATRSLPTFRLCLFFVPSSYGLRHETISFRALLQWKLQRTRFAMPQSQSRHRTTERQMLTPRLYYSPRGPRKSVACRGRRRMCMAED